MYMDDWDSVCWAETHCFSLRELEYWLKRGDIPATRHDSVTSSPIWDDDIDDIDKVNEDEDDDGALAVALKCIFLLNRLQLCALGEVYGLAGDADLYIGGKHPKLLEQVWHAMVATKSTCENCPNICTPDTHLIDVNLLDVSTFASPGGTLHLPRPHDTPKLADSFHSIHRTSFKKPSFTFKPTDRDTDVPSHRSSRDTPRGAPHFLPTVATPRRDTAGHDHHDHH
jgi:hypothetical protein